MSTVPEKSPNARVVKMPAKTAPLERLREFLFGYDLFISYARVDAFRYATRLANQLIKKGFTCYLDQLDTVADERVPDKVKKAIRRSTRFVLVGSKGAVLSDAIKEELAIVREGSRHIIPINVDKALEAEGWYSQITGLPKIAETEESLHRGRPSREVIRGIYNAAKFTRRSRKLNRVFWATLVSIVLLLIVGVVAGSFLISRANAAEAQRVKAEALAGESTAKAREAEAAAQSSAENARYQQHLAELSAKDAQAQEVLAKANAERAESQRQIADAQKRRADEQRTLADAREKAADSISQWVINPDRSLHLAIEAATLARTKETADALRQTLFGNAKRAELTAKADYTNKLAVSSDGKITVMANSDGSIQVWDTETENMITELRAHTGNVWNVAFSHDDRYLVTAGADKTAVVWETKSWRQLFKLEGHAGEVFDAEFSPDTEYIVTASADKCANIWQTKTGQKVAGLCGHPYALTSAKFSPDAKFIATLSNNYKLETSPDKKAKPAWIWETKTWRKVAELKGQKYTVQSLEFSPNSQLIATTSWVDTCRESDGHDGEQCGRSYEAAWIWDVRSWSKLTEISIDNEPMERIDVVKFSPNSKFLITNSFAHDEALVWETSKWNMVAEIPSNVDGRYMDKLRHEHPLVSDENFRGVSNAGFSPDGKFVAITGNTTQVWDTSTWKRISILEIGGGGDYVKFSSDGKSVFTISGHTAIISNCLCGSQDDLLAFARSYAARQLPYQKRDK
jgi:WD40 repeat protein